MVDLWYMMKILWSGYQNPNPVEVYHKSNIWVER